MKTIDSLIISYLDKEKPLMVVGRKRSNESVEIVNAFEGDQATRLWNELTESMEDKKEEKTDVK